MRLADLRKLSVKKHLRIRFPLSNGMECMVDERGIAQVPALRSVPSFNLEDELVGAQAFVVEPAEAGGKDRPQARRLTRDEMTALAAGSGAEAARDEHEE